MFPSVASQAYPEAADQLHTTSMFDCWYDFFFNAALVLIKLDILAVFM